MTGAPTQRASTKKLLPTESRRGLAASTVEIPPNGEPGTDDSAAVTWAASPTNDAPTARFDALEVLGPSLAEVLTFVRPPQPKRLEQQAQDQQAQEQQASGEASQGDDTGDPSAADEAIAASAKFDVCLSRSVVIAKLVDPSVDNSRKTQEYFAKLLDRLQLDATGLVLLQEATAVIFLETTSEQFLEILQHLRRQRILDVSAMRILASSDGHGVRLLQGVYFKKVAITAGASGAELSDDTLRQCVVDTFLNLLKFVKKIGPMPPAEIRKCLTNLSMTDQTFLPANDLVLALLEREELMTLDEFLTVFAEPFDLELESERVWPVHPLIQY